MNTNTHSGRIIVSGIVVGIVFPFATACGTEVPAPAQDISHSSTDKKAEHKPQAPRTERNRAGFDDEYGQAEQRKNVRRPAGSGTRNRMDFGEDHGI